uniref:Uncharacterized protein n=1 Tax=Timema cristinae TaxID=61476 RepID=A0A7R9D1N8_TIMCR|nr:unnamed protein product [Timema cristinae]
MISHALVVL